MGIRGLHRGGVLCCRGRDRAPQWTEEAGALGKGTLGPLLGVRVRVQCWGAQRSSVPAVGAGVQPESLLIPCSSYGRAGAGQGLGRLLRRCHLTANMPSKQTRGQSPQAHAPLPRPLKRGAHPLGHVYPLGAASSLLTMHVKTPVMLLNL